MTMEAKSALDCCSVIVGYPVYLDLIRKDYPEKQYLSTPMRQEEKRWPDGA
jgi:precorrin-3B C17-methyltransferase